MTNLETWEAVSEKISLIPLKGKVPVEQGWQQWCLKKRPFNANHFKGCNAGIACGPASNRFVLDVDCPALFEMTCLMKGWTLPKTQIIETGSGKPHYYFLYPGNGTKYGNKSLKKYGFDVRGIGGQVVAAGSTHPGTGKRYRVVDDSPVVSPPQWLLDLYEESSPIHSQPGGAKLWGGDIQSLPIKRETKDLIVDGIPKPYRSEAIMTVCNALVWANLSDSDIFQIFSSYAIGEKYLEKGQAKEKWLQAHIDKARQYVTDRANINGVQTTAQAVKTTKPTPKGRCLKELKGMFSEKVSWVWREHFPKGLAAMINGREGCGKTTICMQAGKEITEEHPDGTVVWLASEGAVQDTVAKMEELQVNERFVVAQKSDGTFKWNFTDRRELKELETLLDSLPQPILAVFVDSLRGITPYDDNESKIKNVMQAVNAISCDKYKASLIYIHHFSKGQKNTLLDQSTGSTAITSSVRVVLSVLPVSAFKRTIKQAKSNISGNRPELEAVKIGNQIVINEPSQKSEDTLATQAEEFLLKLFDERTKIPAKEIYEKGEALDFSPTLLKNVKKTLGIEATNDGFGTPWFWHWPLYKGKRDSRGGCKKGGDVSTCNHIERHESHENLQNNLFQTESHESHESQLENKCDSNNNLNNNTNISILPKNTPEPLVGRIDPDLARELYGKENR